MGIVILAIALLIWPSDAGVYAAMVWLCWLPQALIMEVVLFMETDFFITLYYAWGPGKSLDAAERALRRNRDIANTRKGTSPAQFAQVQEEALRIAKAQAAALASKKGGEGKGEGGDEQEGGRG